MWNQYFEVDKFWTGCSAQIHLQFRGLVLRLTGTFFGTKHDMFWKDTWHTDYCNSLCICFGQNKDVLCLKLSVLGANYNLFKQTLFLTNAHHHFVLRSSCLSAQILFCKGAPRRKTFNLQVLLGTNPSIYRRFSAQNALLEPLSGAKCKEAKKHTNLS